MLETFRALAEPNRLQIFELLSTGPQSVNGVVERLGIRQPQASKHLRILSDAGLVEVRPAAQQRIYSVRLQPLQELDAWLEPYRRAMEEQYEKLDGLLEELQSAPASKPKSRLSGKRNT